MLPLGITDPSSQAEPITSRADLLVWPWRAEPRQLWSLLDMRQFFARRFFEDVEWMVQLRKIFLEP
jgi:hypothetical protein